jgi:hypothetical protein
MKRNLCTYSNFTFITIFLFLTGCAQNNEVKKGQKQFSQLGTVSYRVEKAPKWTGLFKRNSGWIGGDGIFSIPFVGAHNDNSRVMFLFSDTMIGKINDNHLQNEFKLIHNSIAYLTGSKPDQDSLHFTWKEKGTGSPASMFVPKTNAAQKGDYYWLGDGFVDQSLNNLYIFAYRVRNKAKVNGNKDFPFEIIGNSIIAIPAGGKPPFKNQRQLETPFYKSDTSGGAFRSFGAGILVNIKNAGAPNPDGYVYIYGVQGTNKQLIAARVKPEDFEDLKKWQYWSGNNWDSQIDSIQPITNEVSNELSVSAIGNSKYALIFTVNGIGPEIGMRIGESPVGPFGPKRIIWKSDVKDVDSSLISYNAKAHPAISSPGELLVSYNVNSSKFLQKIKEYPHLYRPRFIRIIFKRALKNPSDG